jgi:transcription elongation factor Elf1
MRFLDSLRTRFARISERSKCPACGHRGCLLKIADTSNGKMVERTCNMCGAVCYEPPVVRADLWTVK